MITSPPQLSICIPAYNRPNWLARALRSIIGQTEAIGAIEIVVTDDSTDSDSEKVVKQTLDPWAGKWQYIHNQPRLGMAANWNHALHLAQGDYILILHDDDFLLPGGVSTILQSINRWGDQHPAILFGVKVVDEQERQKKQQIPSQEQWLPPDEALQNLLSHSSWIRFPAIVVQRQAYLQVGAFRTDVGGPADLEMWLRLLGKFGVMVIPEFTCAYTVHAQALTQQMFNSTTLSQLLAIFEQAKALDVLPVATLEQCKTDFFHQFILAGTYRYLRVKNCQVAQTILALFDSPQLKNLGRSRKWFLLRQAFSGLLWIDRLKQVITESIKP